MGLGAMTCGLRGWIQCDQRRRNEFESEGAHPSDAKLRKNFLVVPLNFFGSVGTISRFGGRFRGGQYSLVSFLFSVLLLTVPPPVRSHL